MAKCWSGAEILCKECKQPADELEEEYGGLSRGGDYERFVCRTPTCSKKGDIICIEMPD